MQEHDGRVTNRIDVIGESFTMYAIVEVEWLLSTGETILRNQFRWCTIPNMSHDSTAEANCRVIRDDEVQGAGAIIGGQRIHHELLKGRVVEL